MRWSPTAESSPTGVTRGRVPGVGLMGPLPEPAGSGGGQQATVRSGQATMARASVPSCSLLPATSRTAASPSTAMSWRTCSGGDPGGGVRSLPTCPVPQFPQADGPCRPSRYIVGTLERTVADRYVLVCLSRAAARGQIPSFSWMKRCYRAMDRR